MIATLALIVVMSLAACGNSDKQSDNGGIDAGEDNLGGFKELTPEFLQKYMTYSYPIQAPISWEQVSVAGEIYTFPKNNATFNNYNVFVARTDLLDKYGDFEINSRDSMKQALITLAENERANGIYANGQRGTAEFANQLWWQNVGAEPLASGCAFMYYTHGNEDLPDWDKDVFHKFSVTTCRRKKLNLSFLTSRLPAFQQPKE